MNVTENLMIDFDISKLDIVGVANNNIYFRTVYIDNESDVEKKCVLILKQSQFKKLMNDFLIEKADFCKRYGHFCGAEHIMMDGINKTKEINLLVGFDEEKEKPIYKDVPAFTVENIELEMEHG